ncbi:hypothetical protein NQ315_012666 [Exocentrus adspersus]|uniref:Vps72/YL1 N-terminal domain-containing protein n=1 Tax=Exocentrus adspersus TaxID=1586481 RepID=A0AAV8VT18_9CUCU|nr:hypothetical protein NQ315_012666 [Exocentrus adspersus]
MQRERRANAGNRMAKLLDEEEECQDEFYKQNYGGFEETESDNEYEAEEEGDDIVDSDFSIDENDEPVSETEGEGEQKKKRRLVTKAYKEPVPVQKKEKQKPKVVKSSTPKTRTATQQQIHETYERKSIRKSTAAKSAATAQRIKVRDLEQRKKVKKPKEEEWVPTQEELLKEAKITERENLKSLEKYQKLENEKKTKRPLKKTCTGPMVQYRSTRMPIIEEVDTSTSSIKNEEDPSKKYCERTFITVMNDPNDVAFKKDFQRETPARSPEKAQVRRYGYVDPVTCVPYHSSSCLKIIRMAYYDYLEHNGDKSNAVVAEFLKWYAKNKRRLRSEMLLSEQKVSFQ